MPNECQPHTSRVFMRKDINTATECLLECISFEPIHSTCSALENALKKVYSDAIIKSIDSIQTNNIKEFKYKS